MRCPKCSERLPDESRFCGACGHAIPASGPDAPGGPATDGQNNRLAPRTQLDVDVTFESEHNFYTGFLENISTGGLFVATHDLKRIGEHVEVRFTVPGASAPCVAQATVRWLRAHGLGPHAAPGMGLQFVDLDGRMRGDIEAFIRLRDPLFYDD